jgi:pilus assembly protein Flp/PilA
MMKMLRKLMKDESGASLIEYVLLAAVIGVGAIIGMQAIRDAANGSFATTSGLMNP